jgi:hypothetical protein
MGKYIIKEYLKPLAKTESKIKDRAEDMENKI